MTCEKCNAEVNAGTAFCPSCGNKMGAPAASSTQSSTASSGQSGGFDNLKNMALNTADITNELDPADIEKNKAMGGLAYFLFFLPLVACPESKYGRFHANQGLIYLILCVGWGIASFIISMLFYAISWRLGWFWSGLSFILWIPVWVG